MTGDTIKTDGQKIYDAIDANLKRANVSPAVKKDKILGQFAFIKDTVKLNEIDEKLNKTPLKHLQNFYIAKYIVPFDSPNPQKIILDDFMVSL